MVVVRAVVLVLSAAVLAVYIWGAMNVYNASLEFTEYLDGHPTLEVRVTRLDGFDGPVNASSPPGRNAATAASRSR